MMNPIMGKKEWLLLLILSLFWGVSFFYNEIIVRVLQPFAALLERSASVTGRCRAHFPHGEQAVLAG
jgi:hypothetical protein